MNLDELRERELKTRKAQVDQLKGNNNKVIKIDLNCSDVGSNIGNTEIHISIAFLVVTSLAAFLFSYIIFGYPKVSICETGILSTLDFLCMDWQLLFMLIFSTVVLPITFLIGMVEFFQSIKEKMSSMKEVSERLQFQEDLNTVTKILIYSLFVFAIQIMVHFEEIKFLPELLKIPFLVFDTDAMLPFALALLYYAIRQKDAFFAIASRFLYAIILINLSSVLFSRGVWLLWEMSIRKFL